MDTQKNRKITKADIIEWACGGLVILVLVCLHIYGYDITIFVSAGLILILVGAAVFNWWRKAKGKK